MADNPKALQEEIDRFIEEAKAHAQNGENISLEGLDEKIRHLCEVVITLPPSEAKPYQDSLADISSELESLRDVLLAQQSDIRDELESLNLRQKAVKAYQTSATTTGGDKPPKKK